MPSTGLPFVIKEGFLKGKESTQTNEDGIGVTPDFVAVVDGATAKSDFVYDGKKTGRLAMELVMEAIRDFPKEIAVDEAVNRITNRIRQFYADHDLWAVMGQEPERRFTASAVIYSHSRKEVWQVGDCPCRIGTLYVRNEKAIDGIMANARAAFNEMALLEGKTMDDLAVHDVGREFILPFLRRQAWLQNAQIEGQAYAFPVFDGFPVSMELVNVFPVDEAEEVILASDGYPQLFPTLQESERYLARVLEEDPLCMRIHKSTKGVKQGNCSFDDRAYIRIGLK